MPRKRRTATSNFASEKVLTLQFLACRRPRKRIAIQHVTTTTYQVLRRIEISALSVCSSRDCIGLELNVWEDSSCNHANRAPGFPCANTITFPFLCVLVES